MSSAEQPPIKLTLFISTKSLASAAAVENVVRALRNYPPNAFDLEVIDVFSDPQRLLREKVFVTPTLVAAALAPRAVGELGDVSLLGYFLQSLLTCVRAET